MTDRTTLDAWHVLGARQFTAGMWLDSKEWTRPRWIASVAGRRMHLVDLDRPGGRRNHRLVRLPADVVVTKKGERDDEE